MGNNAHYSNPPLGGFEAVRLKWATMSGRSRGEAMRKTNSRVPMLLIALMLGSLMTWAPPVAAEGELSLIHI